MIEDQGSPLAIAEQCRLVSVNRSTWYYDGKDEREENVELMNMMDELHLDHPTWGSRTMRDHFRNMSRSV